jgi:hypothetical protein
VQGYRTSLGDLGSRVRVSAAREKDRVERRGLFVRLRDSKRASAERQRGEGATDGAGSERAGPERDAMDGIEA